MQVTTYLELRLLQRIPDSLQRRGNLVVYKAFESSQLDVLAQGLPVGAED